MDNMFTRTAMLIGADNMDRLQSSKVAVFGIGGVGGYVAESLVRSGIGGVALIDYDVVDETNINRQVIALRSTIGQPKVQIMHDRLKDINPNLNVDMLQQRISLENIDQFDFEKYHYIVDAIDDVSAKLLIVENAQKHNVPIISSMGTGNKMNPEQLEVTDIKKTSMCPLARVVRKELRNRGIESLKVVFSKEKPFKAAENSEVCVPASISFVPASAGLLISSEVIKDLIII